MNSIPTSPLPGSTMLFSYRLRFQQFILAFAVTLGLFLWQGHIGLNLWDEGFLWYGVQRVMVGEIPIRDFMAYDPGRYYWSGALMGLWGDNGIVALRGSAALFQALGLFIGLLLVTGNTRKVDYGFWLAATAIFILWMFPSHKLFDISLSILLVGVLSYLIQHPSVGRYFLAGVSIGLIAIMGRNHGVYGALSGFATILFLSIRRQQGPTLIKGLSIWSLGVLVGYLPMLILLALDPVFASAFIDSIRFLFEYKGTNLGLPIPWPWKLDFTTLSLFDIIRGTIVGFLFIAVAAWGICGIAWAIKSRLQGRFLPVPIIASAFAAIPYAHFAYSRADIPHLCQGLFPFLIGMLVLIRRLPQWPRWLMAALMLSMSAVVMIAPRPGWLHQITDSWLQMTVGNDTLLIDPNTADILRMIRQLSDDFAAGERPFVAAPFWPGAYAAMFRKAPTWEIFALYPRNSEFQEAEIERMDAAKPGFVVIFDYALDGQDSLRYRNTHPLVVDYIVENYIPLTGYTTNPAYQLYKNKPTEP